IFCRQSVSPAQGPPSSLRAAPRGAVLPAERSGWRCSLRSASASGTRCSTARRPEAVRGRSLPAASPVRARSWLSPPFAVVSPPYRSSWRLAVLSGLADVGGNILYVQARALLALGLAAALSGIYPLFTMILARFIL